MLVLCLMTSPLQAGCLQRIVDFNMSVKEVAPRSAGRRGTRHRASVCQSCGLRIRKTHAFATYQISNARIKAAVGEPLITSLRYHRSDHRPARWQGDKDMEVDQSMRTSRG